MKKLMTVAVLVMALCLLMIGCQPAPATTTGAPAHEHTWQAATCEAPMTCACGETQGEALGHTAVVLAAVEATCTADGMTEGAQCSVCNAVLTAQEAIPAKGHVPGAEPTCATPQNCTVCKKMLKGTTDDHVPGPEATCSTAQTCTLCSAFLKDATGEHVPGAEATCSVPQLCTVCGDVVAGPNPDLHVPGAEATCSTPQLCLDCYAVVVPAKGHTLENYVCTVCGIAVEPLNYTYYLNTKVFSNVGTLNLNGIDWTLDADWANKGNDAKNGDTFKDPGTDPAKMWRGQQFGAGSASAHMNWMTLKSAEFTNITRIRVRAQGVAGFVGTITVKVGDTIVLEETTLFDDPDSEYKKIAVAEGADDYYYFIIDVDNLNGPIEIIVKQPETEKAFYIGAISVDYAEAKVQLTAQNYTYYLNTKVYSDVGTLDLNGVEWTLDADWANKGNDAKNGDTFKDPGTDIAKMWRGQQFGSGSASGHMNWMTLTSTEFNNITRIRIRAQGVSGFVGTISVKVANTVVLEETNLFDDPDSEYKKIAVSEGADDYYYFIIDVENLNGPIEIKVRQPDTEKAFYIGAISVDYAI